MKQPIRIITYQGDECPQCGKTYQKKTVHERDYDLNELFEYTSSFTCDCGYKFVWAGRMETEFKPHSRE